MILVVFCGKTCKCILIDTLLLKVYPNRHIRAKKGLFLSIFVQPLNWADSRQTGKVCALFAGLLFIYTFVQHLDEVRATSRAPTSASSASTASTGVLVEEVSVTARAKELSAQADLLKDQLRTLPDECSGVRDMLTTNLSLVLRKLCSVTGGMQTSPQA